MKSLIRIAMAAGMICCVAAAQAQEARPVAKVGTLCIRVGKPVIPQVEYKGRAAYRAVVAVKAGRVVSVEFRNLVEGVPRRADRALKNALMLMYQEQYECPGDHVFEQEFSFDFP